jgi:hypothetical protein
VLIGTLLIVGLCSQVSPADIIKSPLSGLTMNMLNSYRYPKHDIEYIKQRNATNIAQLDVELNNRSILKPAL